jgi:hypothetical protein
MSPGRLGSICFIKPSLEFVGHRDQICLRSLGPVNERISWIMLIEWLKKFAGGTE